jgi:expansin (peptidoglycan-binding protein)
MSQDFDQPPFEPPASEAAASGRPSRHRRRSPVAGWSARRWLVAGAGAVVAASVLSLALVVQASGSPACAAPPLAGTTHSGKATHFDGSKGGNCSYGPPSSNLYVALGPSEYSQGAACGGYIDVKGPKGTVRVKVVDQCPECPAGHLDLSEAAFAKIGVLNDGIIPITYQGVRDAQTPGPVQIRIKDGASQYWLAVLADNVGAPLRSMEVKTSSGWSALHQTDYNYWLDDNGAGQGPFTLRLTDVYGRQATVSGITLSPLKTQTTNVFLTGSAQTGTVQSGGGTKTTGAPAAGPATTQPAAPAAQPTASDSSPDQATPELWSASASAQAARPCR